MIIQPGVDTETAHGLTKAAGATVNLCRCNPGRRGAAGGEGIPPRGRRIPNVLHGRVIVEGDAEDQLMVIAICATKRKMVRIANIGVVEPEVVGHAVVGQLYERPQAVGNLTGVEKTHLFWKEQIAVLGERALDGAVR